MELLTSTNALPFGASMAVVTPDRVSADVTLRDGERAYSRTIVTDGRGVPHAEGWAVEGLSHAWSGGSWKARSPTPADPTASST